MSPCLQYLPTGKHFVNPQDIYQRVSAQYSDGMSIHETRRSNLVRLIKDRFDGKQRRLADDIDRQPDYISRILNGSKNVGEKFARHVEQSLGLPDGYLDVPEDGKGYPVLRFSRGSNVSEDVGGYGDKPSNQELEFVGHLDAWDGDTELDDDEVEVPLFREVELAAGAGQTQVVENHGPKLRFAKSTLSRAGVMPEHAACAFVRGNSMEPVMPDGTCVGVNTADKIIRDGEIYAIDHDGMLRVKYLHRRPGGGVKIVSQNSAEYPAEELTVDEMAATVRLIGRVFWWSVLR